MLFLDEISTGLDSSTTYAIVKFLADTTHFLSYTTVIALLQPAPETYDLFDDVLLLCDGEDVAFKDGNETASAGDAVDHSVTSCTSHRGAAFQLPAMSSSILPDPKG